jgi:putative ABC transport system permease protein
MLKLNTRWSKLGRDLRNARGRMVMMVLAIAAGLFGVGTILSTYTILTREISRNYLDTRPASAMMELHHAEKGLVEEVRRHPLVEEAEAGSWLLARVETVAKGSVPLQLFVVEEFASLRLNRFTPVSGEWPPPTGSLLLERTALPFLEARVGQPLSVQTPNGPKRELLVSGVVHDPSLAPSWQEQTAYGYVTPETLRYLGESGELDILKILVKDTPYDGKAIEQAVAELSALLEQKGSPPGEIRIPPPGKHPHQGQMTAILVMLLIFSGLALVLSSVLTATMIGGMLAGQIRQIGVMKAIGARTSQIAGIYLVLMLAIGLVSVLLAVPPAIATGWALAKVVGDLLNFTIHSYAVPVWVYLVLLLAGMLVPLLTALVPILRVARITVREAISDFGIGRGEAFGSSLLDRLLGRLRMLDRTLLLALRNTFRRRGRLILTLGLLAAAGSMFMTSLNVKSGWEQVLSEAAAGRHYDLEVKLNQFEGEQRLLGLLQQVPQVQSVELWSYASAGPERASGLHIVRTYPDGGHGSFNLRSAPLQTEAVSFELMQGRWLQPADAEQGVVLNHTAYAQFPGAKLGDQITLNVDGAPAKLTLVGVVRENLSTAAAYVSPAAFAKITGEPGKANGLRILLKERTTEARGLAGKDIERLLQQEQMRLLSLVSEDLLDEAVSEHVYILIFALIMMSVILAVVGALGLLSMMGTQVVERTREFGIMRTIGGTSRTVLRGILAEGVFIGLMSWVIALALSLPLSFVIGKHIGELAFRSPLPLVLSPLAILAWIAIILAGSAAASWLPAHKASRLTIRDTLDYM